MKLILWIVSLCRKIAAAGFLVVVPDFFYGDPVIDLNDPNFDVNSWIKVHNIVSILLFSCKLLDEHMKNCARIKKTSRGLFFFFDRSRGTCWFAFDVQIDMIPHVYVYECFGGESWDLSWNRMTYYLLCMTWTFLSLTVLILIQKILDSCIFIISSLLQFWVHWWVL